ncbi:hypothetical protein GW17_00007610 [Ensete ventricosum]|nr:hypothetical protein GW17_00007610 [Ensete ventricosum]
MLLYQTNAPNFLSVSVKYQELLHSSKAIENDALDGCPGIEKEGRFQRRKAMGRESVCDPWISDRETISKLRG